MWRKPSTKEKLTYGFIDWKSDTQGVYLYTIQVIPNWQFNFRKFFEHISCYTVSHGNIFCFIICLVLNLNGDLITLKYGCMFELGVNSLIKLPKFINI